MAIKKVIEIDVEQVKAMGGLDALQDSLKATEEKSVSLKAELRKLKEQLAQLPEGSAEYDKIAKKAGEVSDKLGDINTRIKNLGSDTKNIDAVVEGAQALSGAFTIATSASALLGSENKELQETMLKVESAIGLTVGIQSVANALQKETALSIGLNTIATKIQIGAQLAYTAVVGGTTGALKALRVALASTGVGVIVILLGTLIAKLTESADAVEENTEKLDDYKKSLDSSTESINSFNDALERQSKADVLRAKIAGKSEKEILDIKVKSLEFQKRNIDEQIKKDQELIESQKLGYEKTIALIDRQDKLRKESSDLRFEIESQGLEYELELADKRREAQEKASEEAKKRAKERADELIRIEKEKHAKLLEEANKFFADAKQQEDDYNTFLEQRQQRFKEFTDTFETPEQKAQRELDADLLSIENSKLGYEMKLELLEEFNNKVLENDAISEEQKRQYAEQTLQYKKILQQQELALVGQTLGKIGALFGEQSKVGKAFAIGQALINTYQGITAELATKATTPYEIGLKVVNVAYIAKTGFDSVKRILATNTGSSGGSGGSTPNIGSAPTSATPQFNIVGQNTNNQLAQSISQQQQRPVEAYVVAGNVTTAQSLDRNKIDTATFN